MFTHNELLLNTNMLHLQRSKVKQKFSLTALVYNQLKLLFFLVNIYWTNSKLTALLSKVEIQFQFQFIYSVAF